MTEDEKQIRSAIALWHDATAEGDDSALHVFDRHHQPMAKGVVVPAGQGIVDVAACVAELKQQDFKGHFSIEHENDWKDSVPKIKESVSFLKSEWAK